MSIIITRYTNLDHSEVERDEYLKELAPNGGFDELHSHMQERGLPIVFSGQGIDREVIGRVNGKLEQILFNEDATRTNGFFGHMLPTMYPDLVPAQLKRGARSLDASPSVLMVPEFDVSPGQLATLSASGARFVLLQDGPNNFYEYREDMSPSTQTFGNDLVNVVDHQGTKIGGIVTYGPELRSSYLKMARGLVEPEQFVRELIETDENSQTPVKVFLTDAEVPLINGSFDVSHAFIDTLADAYHDGALDLTGFTDESLDRLTHALEDAPSVQLAPRGKAKWLYSERTLETDSRIRNILPEVHELDTYHQNALLIATMSDLYSADFGRHDKEGNVKSHIVELPTEGRDGQIVTISSDPRRAEEVEHIIYSIEHKKRVVEDMGGLSNASQAYMRILDDSLNL